MKIRTKEALINYINTSNDIKFVFFEDQHKVNTSTSCFSQWHNTPFLYNAALYKTAEHFIQAEKSRLFGNYKLALQIIAADSPEEAIALSRAINNFCKRTWARYRFEIVVYANLYKFSQNDLQQKILLSTSNSILVKANPEDRVWGIGLSRDSNECQDPKLWQGLNLLGFALMEVRGLLLKTLARSNRWL